MLKETFALLAGALGTAPRLALVTSPRAGLTAASIAAIAIIEQIILSVFIVIYLKAFAVPWPAKIRSHFATLRPRAKTPPPFFAFAIFRHPRSYRHCLFIGHNC